MKSVSRGKSEMAIISKSMNDFVNLYTFYLVTTSIKKHNKIRYTIVHGFPIFMRCKLSIE